MERVYYFAYSHHIDPKEMRSLGIQFYSNCLCKLHDHRLEFNVLEDEYFRFETRGIANIEPQAGSRVEGVLYELDECDISLLDKDAGVQVMKYYRKCVDVVTKNKAKRAYAYAAWPDVTSKGLYPNEKLLSHILDAARNVGISFEYQRWLQSMYAPNIV